MTCIVMKKSTSVDSMGPLRKAKKDLYPELYKKKSFVDKVKSISGYKLMGSKSLLRK